MSKKSATMPRIRRAAIAAVLASGALVMPAAAAQADPPVVSVSDGTLLAGGAAISVTTTVNCSDGYGYGSVQLLQRRGNLTVRGYTPGSTSFTCTGATQTFTVLIAPEGGAVFKAGEAVATASAYTCIPESEECDEAGVSRVIQVRR